MLNCSSSTDRFQSAKALLDYGFANYALVNAEPDEPLKPLHVVLGTQDTLTPVLQETAPILIEKGEQSKIVKTVSVCEEIAAPVTAGQQLGTLTLSAGERVLAEIPIIAPETVERLTLWELTLRLLRTACMSG